MEVDNKGSRHPGSSNHEEAVMKGKVDTRKARSPQVFSMTENQCIWMKVGIVNFKLCENAYDCLSCPFDKAMVRSLQRKNDGAGWGQTLRARAAGPRECRHMLTGRVQYHFCSNNYRCNVCEFDQYLEERDLTAATEPLNTDLISGFHVAGNYYYHRGHSWARVEHGGFVRVGMDDFALKLVGHPTKMDLPKIGAYVEQTQVGWRIHNGEKEARLLSPIKGIVVATNQKAAEQPGAVKKDPYGQGWLMVVEPLDLKNNLKNLLFEQEAVTWVGAEARRLDAKVIGAYGMPLAATGGEIVDDIIGNLPHLEWDDVIHEFLLT
jgi:glycine cleavage system H lipoate-binding protein